LDFVPPLWMLLISAATLVVGNPFAAAFGVSIILSLVTLWLLISRVATGFWPGILAGAGLVLSKAYVDYSTSGLENPLSHFLLVCGLLLGFRLLNHEDSEHLDTWAMTTLFALYLCSPALLLLVLPFCVAVLWRSYRNLQRLAAILEALGPILVWMCFAFFYYGALVPGVDLKALAVGFTQSANVQRGIFYIVNSISQDPITLAFILTGVFIALRQPIAERALAAGIVLYLACIIAVGGDPMSGRLLTAPLLVAAVILVRTDLSVVGDIGIAAVFAVLGAMSAQATILSGPTYTANESNNYGIIDARGVEFKYRGLLNASRYTFAQPNDWIPRP